MYLSIEVSVNVCDVKVLGTILRKPNFKVIFSEIVLFSDSS